MKKLDVIVGAFLNLVKGGLWDKDVQLSNYDNLDFTSIQKLAEVQSVVGLVTEGMEHVTVTKIPKQVLLQFIGQSLQLEQQNAAMNNFIGVIIEKMREEKLYAVLVKGQGLAQCYERPLWRAYGDIDLLLDKGNYEGAKVFFAKIASFIEQEEFVSKHIGFTVDPWLVELHGHMYFGLSHRAYRVVLEVERNVLQLGEVRVWNNDGVDVHLPSPDNDIILVFTHFLGHFCFGGVGLRQLCDLCRLLWTFREQIDKNLLARRLKEMGLESEWGVFATLAVNWLGMPSENMPLYSPSKSNKRRAQRALCRILKTGHLGQNNDESYRNSTPKLYSSVITLWRRFGDFFSLMTIFPLDAPLFFKNYLKSKVEIEKAKRNHA